MEIIKSIWDVFIILDNFDTRENNITIKSLGTKQPSRLKYAPDSAWGRDGFKKISEDAFEGFERTTVLNITDADSYYRLMDKIYVGLELRVYYSDDNGKHRYGVISDIQDNIASGNMREVSITIDLQPFKYGAVTTINITKETNIVNLGNVYNLPRIKVYPKANATTGNIYINGKKMFLYVTDMIIIDSEKVDIFNVDGLRANSKRISGDFQRIKEGNNVINFDGDIDKLELEIKWRWR